MRAVGEGGSAPLSGGVLGTKGSTNYQESVSQFYSLPFVELYLGGIYPATPRWVGQLGSPGDVQTAVVATSLAIFSTTF